MCQTIRLSFSVRMAFRVQSKKRQRGGACTFSTRPVRYDTQYGGRIILIETVDQVADLDVRQPDELAFVSQTTLSVDDTRDIINALKARFPGIQAPRLQELGASLVEEASGIEENVQFAIPRPLRRLGSDGKLT